MRASKYLNQRGIALMLVLWGGVILAFIAASLATRNSGEVALTRTHMHLAEADALAMGLVHETVADLLAGPSAAPLMLNGTPVPRAQEPWQISLAVSDEAGKIALNAAPDALLAAFLAALDVPDDDAVFLAAVIADWRDRDEEARLPGSEEGAANRAFLTVDELARVSGLDRALAARAAPHLSVYASQMWPDLFYASPFVREVTLRAAPGLSNRIPEDAALAAQTPSGQGLFEVLIGLSHEEGLIYQRRAVIRLTDDPTAPFELREWQRRFLPAEAVSR